MTGGMDRSETPEIALVFGKAGSKPTYGRAYFELVTELRQRRIPFLSLTVTDPITAYIKAVVTTRAESRLIRHPHVVIYNGRGSRRAAEVVDRTIQLMRGKEICDELIIGVDPGERTGIAAVADGEVLKVRCCSEIGETISVINRILRDIEARRKVVRVGASFKPRRGLSIPELDRALPPDVGIEVVPENSTTRGLIDRRPGRRGLRDIYSAVRISARKGRQIRRDL